MEELIEQWLSFAAQDFDVAKHLYDHYYPRPLEIICYHCQQAAEKAIKAVILSCGAPGGLPKSHDLVFLLNQVKNQVNVENIYPAAQILTPYGVMTRYPGEMDVEEHNARRAVDYAGIILDWARENVKRESAE